MLHWGKASSLGALNNIEGQYETQQSKSFKQHLNLTGILHLLCNKNVFSLVRLNLFLCIWFIDQISAWMFSTHLFFYADFHCFVQLNINNKKLQYSATFTVYDVFKHLLVS